MVPIKLLLAVLLAAVMAADSAWAATLPMAWRIEQTSEPASGGRSCTLVSRFGNVTARLGREPGATAPSWSVAVGFDNAPSSLRYLRINKAVYTTAGERFRGAEAAAIVARLKAPGEFAFEWAKQPDFAKQQGLFGTGDFAAKAVTCESWVRGPRA